MPPRPTNTYDASQMKLHLNEYVNEISDMLTSEQDIERYADFTQVLIKLNGLTEYYHTLSENATYPLLTEQDKKQLMDTYDEAIRQAAVITGSSETGAVGEQMRSIAETLMPMMLADHAALEMTDVSREPVTLPLLIGNARSQAVDMGNQQAEIASGQMSERQHIKVQNGGVMEEGYFTPATTLELNARYREHLDKMEKKYPEFKPIIDAFRAGGINGAFLGNVDYNIYDQCDEEMDADNIKAQMFENCRDNIFALVDIEPEVYQPFEQEPDYLKFMDEFSMGMKPLKGDYIAYKSGRIVLMEDGANIDKRNVGMSRMGRLLGKPDLVAEAKPMMLIQNGKPVVGTFMKNAHGLDMSKVKPNAPITKFTAENFNNPAAFSDIAAMQAIDFICGNVDRHSGNFFLRFDSDPQKNPDAKLVGLSLIDNDMSFSNASAGDTRGSKFVNPEEMGVIGQDTYTAIKTMTKEQMQFVLADCGLSQQEIDKAWERKEALQSKIEEDMEFFKDKEAGVLAEGRIRVVKENEWDKYSIQKIAEVSPRSQFKTILNAPTLPQRFEAQRQENKKAKQNAQYARNVFLGIEPQAEAAPQQNREIPTGKVVGNGIAQEADPLNVAREETIKLAVPDLAKIKSVGGALSERFPMSYQTEHGEQQAFFTARSEQTVAFRIKRIFDKAIKDNPNYADELRKFQSYCDITDYDIDIMQDDITHFQPLMAPIPDYTVADIPKERAEQLSNDAEFRTLSKNVIGAVWATLAQRQFYLTNGIAVGQRLETRNVAMSDIGDVLGVPDVIARSTTAQVMSGGSIIDGVLTNKAEGVDIRNVGDGHPMKLIGDKQAEEVYNQPEALKKLADLQVLDYICMNNDRRANNMTYLFDGLGTDKPKFTGVQGFDNDLSFGTNVPEPTKITVISESMAEKLKDPKLLEQIAEAMQKNNLPESEIKAAKQRLEKIKTAAENGQIRTVKDDEWGKQEQNTTIEQLAQAKDSIFHVVQNKVIKPFAKEAKLWLDKPEDQRIPQPTKELKYCKARKVGSFGMNAQEHKQLDTLQKEAEKEFAATMENTIQTAKRNDSMTTKEYLQTLKMTSKRVYDQLDAADPTFHATSKEYKELLKASKELQNLSSKLDKKLGNNKKLDVDDNYKLSRALCKVSNCAAAFNAKKQGEIEEGREPSRVGRLRMEASETAAFSAKTLYQEFRKSLSFAQAESSPIAHVHRGIKDAQMLMTAASGEKLRDLVASQIYYRGLASSSLTAKKSTKLLDALNPDVMDKGVEQIKESAAFKAVAGMRDDELRALAKDGDGGRLMDRFFREAAKSKRADIEQLPRQREAENLLNRNEPKQGMN